MRREEKYPNTKTFKFNNVNPKNKYTSDCVIRSIALAEGRTWKEVFLDLSEVSVSTGYMITDTKCYGKYLESKGWSKQKQPKKSDNTKYTGKEFCERLSSGRQIVAHIGGNHVVAIIDDKVNDVWDCTDKTIGNYWVKGEK